MAIAEIRCYQIINNNLNHVAKTWGYAPVYVVKTIIYFFILIFFSKLNKLHFKACNIRISPRLFAEAKVQTFLLGIRLKRPVIGQ